MTQMLARLWRVPFRYAVWLALPVQLLTLWICYRGIQTYVHVLSCKNSFFATNQAPLDLEQWRYFARDEFRKSLSGLFAPAVPSDKQDGLETLSLLVHGSSQASLNSNLPLSGKSKYYPGLEG